MLRNSPVGPAKGGLRMGGVGRGSGKKGGFLAWVGGGSAARTLCVPLVGPLGPLGKIPQGGRPNMQEVL